MQKKIKSVIDRSKGKFLAHLSGYDPIICTRDFPCLFSYSKSFNFRIDHGHEPRVAGITSRAGEGLRAAEILTEGVRVLLGQGHGGHHQQV